MKQALDFPVDCNALTGCINVGYENINHLALIVKTHGLPIVEVIRDTVNLRVRNGIIPPSLYRARRGAGTPRPGASPDKGSSAGQTTQLSGQRPFRGRAFDFLLSAIASSFPAAPRWVNGA